MERAERSTLPARWRSAAALAIAAGLTLVYVTLPEEAQEHDPNSTLAGDEVERKSGGLEILDVEPLDPYPGGTITVSYVSSLDPASLHVYAGKSELHVLARPEQALVAQVPSSTLPGHAKIRVATEQAARSWLAPAGAQKAERSPDTLSKPFHIRIKALNWRKAFRNLIGGIALVLFGIGLLSRGVRESIGMRLATRLAKLVDRRAFALGLGSLAGAVAHSTTGAAGLLAAFVGSRVLPVVPAAVAFLGVQLGAAITPLLATGLVEPQEGLVAVAIGVACWGLASNRGARAIARLVLGAGLLALGVQVFRPGLEPLLVHPSLLAWSGPLAQGGVSELALRVALGAFLAAALQGPGPLIVLMLGVAQTTGRWELRGALALLAGTGLGTAIGALVTTPPGPRGKQLARLQLVLGAASSLLAACTVDVWARVSDFLLAGRLPPAVHFGPRIPLPELGLHLAVAYALSQLAVATVLALLTPRLGAWLKTREIESGPQAASDPLRSVRDALEVALGRQADALADISIMVRTSARASGRAGEHGLAEARRQLEGALGPALRMLPGTQKGRELSAATFACLQLQQSLETLLRRAERVTDERITGTIDSEAPTPWNEAALLHEVHTLVCEGLQAARARLAHSQPLDIDAARAREIHLNRLEAQARNALLAPAEPGERGDDLLGMLQVIDAYEATGNQIYRLAEALDRSELNLPH